MANKMQRRDFCEEKKESHCVMCCAVLCLLHSTRVESGREEKRGEERREFNEVLNWTNTSAPNRTHNSRRLARLSVV